MSAAITLNDLGLIQGDILINGFPKKAEIFCFFTIRAAGAFSKNIKSTNIATGKDVLALRKEISGLPDKQLKKTAMTNIAFTRSGLTKMGDVTDSFRTGLPDLQKAAPSFWNGMQDPNERNELGDPEFKEWNAAVGSSNGVGPLDGVLIVAGSDRDTVRAELQKVLSQLNGNDEVVKELGREEGKEREKDPGHEHFGYLDGVSHPQVIGIDGPGDRGKLGFPLDKVNQPKDSSNSVEPGVILVGRKGDNSNLPAKPAWARDSSFLVFRKLEQHVGAWNDYVVKNGGSNSKQFGAQLMGRWKSGCPIQKSPDDDVPKLAFENDFKFARGDAKNCPFAAHIRKSHIRQGLNSSRIMRRGIPYGGDFVDGGPDKDRGLLFACYQSTIERGYGFIQKAWANKADFPEIGKSGFDVTIGQSKDTKANQFFVANGSRSTPINPANDFVTTKGGEYFFVPSINLLKNGFDLSQLPKPKVGQPELKA